MMRERGGRDTQFRADLTNDESFGMRGKKEPHDAQPGLRPKGGEHVSVAGNLVVWGYGDHDHGLNSIFL